MRYCRFFPAVILVFLVLGFASCQKDTTEEKKPEVVICWFEPYVPIRVISSTGADLLSPPKLPDSVVTMKWEYPGGGTMPFTKMNPARYSAPGQPDQYLISAPLTHADKGLTVYFSLKAGETDTLFIRTAASSSKPYGFAEALFNGKRVDPKMLLGNTQYGLELVKDGSGN